jgi:hypothetical protein
MPNNSKFDLWQYIVAFIGSICIAIFWFMTYRDPDQFPQSLAELFAAGVNVVVIGFNILMFLALGAAIRRQVAPPAPPAPQVYVNGSVWVAVMAMLCVTVVAMHRIPSTATDGPEHTVPPRVDLPLQSGGCKQPVQPAHETLVYRAEGFGIAGAKAKTSDERRRSAVKAAMLIANATLLEQMVGAIYKWIVETEDGQLDRDSIVKIVEGWLPRSQIVCEIYDDAVGEANIVVEMVLTEELLQEIRQRSVRIRNEGVQ